jgi:hypothetical protein
MVDEETPLTTARRNSRIRRKEIYVNIELFRFYGLLGIFVLLLTGKYVSQYAVIFPPKDDPSSVWDKLFNGAQSDFDTEQTFIYHLFHFNHTCSVLDFNPSKTISALVMMLHTVPIDCFVILHYYRVTLQTDSRFDALKKFTTIATPLQFVFFTYFYMVFVNSPDGEYGTDEGMNKFKWHYIPYMLEQTATLLMAVQQCWYIVLKELRPFPWITCNTLWRYCQFLMVILVVYTWFIWSFIFENPVWDTTTDFGRIAAITIMWGWNVFAILVPCAFAWVESRDGDCTRIVFEEL